MRILFLTEGLTIPASRFRVMQFIPHFEREGIECVVRPSYGVEYNDRLGNPGFGLYRLTQKLNRLHDILDVDTFDLVFLQRPTLPFAPVFEAMIYSQDIPMILDVDDAIYLNSHGSVSRVRQWNMHEVTHLMSKVLVGNSHLADRFENARSLEIIPTVVDTDVYTKRTNTARDEVVIGWMGTSSNFVYIDLIRDAMLAILSRHPTTTFRIVSNATYQGFGTHPQVEHVRWRASHEVSDLQDFDIGIMPLAPSLAALGKCAFKAIQYMAVGIPVVASPIGANVDVITAKTGVMPDDKDWESALSNLIEDKALRDAMGRAGRKRAVELFSINARLPDYIRIFGEVVSA